MGIDVYWKDEHGAVLGVVEDDGALGNISGLLYRQSASVCLRFIDPAGDACFNQQQLPVLVAELRDLLPSVPAKSSAHVHAIVRLLAGASRTHTYIWFVGDQMTASGRQWTLGGVAAAESVLGQVNDNNSDQLRFRFAPCAGAVPAFLQRLPQ